MCGICGVMYFDGGVPERKTVEEMRDCLTHRGPDDCGTMIDGPVGLGHRRLSIIDLSERGRQPMVNEDGSVWITYNGELYNHLVLREKLESLGHRYATDSDTETILHLYEEYGGDCVKLMNGMFAFAVWDSKKKTLFLARDRLGIKPLYYLADEKKFLFASEAKGILAHPDVEKKIDFKSLNNYLTYGYVGSPDTIFTCMSKLPPAHTLTVRDGEASTRRYWTVSLPEKPYGDEAYHLERIRELIKKAVERRLMSDVPLGAFLSGGVDSSIIVAFMSELSDDVKTFSVGFTESSFNELEHAKVIADKFGTDHHEFVVDMDAVELLPKLLHFYDEPFADSSAIPTYIVSEMARTKVTVCLSGDGGDELFAGYDRYAACRAAGLYEKVPKPVRDGVAFFVNRLPTSTANKSLFRMSQRFANAVDLPEEERYGDWITLFKEDGRRQLYAPATSKMVGGLDSTGYIKRFYGESSTGNFIENTMLVDVKTYLPEDLLVKVDRASMAHALEVRVPFLDHELVEYSQSIPLSLKFPGLRLKHLLKKSVRDVIPKGILERRKHGFGVPVGEWFKRELKNVAYDKLLGRQSPTREFFDAKYVEKMLDDHVRGRAENSYRIWTLLFFDLWCRKYLRGEDIRL
ncbi:MAG: asparagine synthase (glutamine-hydrolyzing) [Candidatus Altiarchaeota archaeon]